MTQTLARIGSRLGARLLIAAAAALPCTAAFAQSAAEGQILYGKTIVTGVRSCLSCHGLPTEDPVILRGAEAARIKGATMSQARMTALHGFISDAEYNHMAAYIGQALGVAPTYLTVSAAPSVSLSATTLTFASRDVSTASPAQTVTVTNAATATGGLSMSSITVLAGSEFTVSGGTCSTSTAIAPGSSCTVGVVFRPAATGVRTGTLRIAHNGASGASDVALSGQGVNLSPAVSLSPLSLTFASAIGADSASMRATLSNTGTAALTLSAVTLGGTHAAEYRLAASSTCAAGASVAGGSSCVADIVFKPVALGARVASLTFGHNAAGAASTVTLAGTGTAAPEAGIALDASTIDLGPQVVGATSAARTLTLTNSGAAPLVLSALTTSGVDAATFTLGGTCTAGVAVPARGACTVLVSMRPSTLGQKAATLTISSNAPSGPVTVALRGTSVDTPSPQVGLSQPAVGFGSVTIGTQTIGQVVLKNLGTAPLTVQSINSTSAEYAVSHDCPASLAVAAACTVSITYKAASENSAESVVITTNALSSPNSIVVTGQGTTATLPELAWQPAAAPLTFASTVVGMGSASQGLTLVNKGPGTVTLTSLGTAGEGASSFAVASTSTCRVGLTLSVNATCTVSVSFVPGSSGAKVANLQIGSTGTQPGDVVLSGVGSSPSLPAGNLTANLATLDFTAFGGTPGDKSSPLTVVLNNGGTAAVAISSIQVSGPFEIRAGVSGACPAGASSLAAGATCTVSVVHAPTAAGVSTGKLSVVATGRTVDVNLKGAATVSPEPPAAEAPSWGTQGSAWAFASTAVGMTHALQTRTLTNPGSVAITLTSVTVSGSDSAQFALSQASTCKAATVLAAGATCQVALSFTPASAGTKTATLQVASSGGAAVPVTLSGVGAPPAGGGTPTEPAPPASPSLAFDLPSLKLMGALGTPSAPATVVLTNSGSATATVASIETAGPFQVANSAAGGCGVPQQIAPAGQCSIAVVFNAPASTGVSTGTLTVTDAAGTSTVVQLSGTAVMTNAGQLDGELSGGGAVDGRTLAIAALALLAMWVGRRRFGGTARSPFLPFSR